MPVDRSSPVRLSAAANSRRRFLLAGGAAVAAAASGAVGLDGIANGLTVHAAEAEEKEKEKEKAPDAAAKPAARPRIALIFTELRFRSHAFNFLENFLGPYLFRGQEVAPPVDIVSLYADQFPDADMARDVSKRLNLPLFPTIDAALGVGGQELAVDGVLSIVEHGTYPVDELGRTRYPRKEFFDQAVATMRRSGRFVPLFNYKHLAYAWEPAKAMYDTARMLGVPLMAGSSVPLAQRRQPLEIPAGARFDEIVSVHGGGVEVYDFHAAEVLQSMIEARQGGESGVARVEFVDGERLKSAVADGRISRAVADAALAAELGEAPKSWDEPIPGDKTAAPPHAVLITYRDGTRATLLKVGGNANRWNFACRLRGEQQVRATSLYNGPWGNRNLFQALSHAVQRFFVSKRAPYPVERTLLSGGIVDAALASRAAGKAVDTPQLDIRYAAGDWSAFRENGASWQILTKDSPEPRELRGRKS